MGPSSGLTSGDNEQEKGAGNRLPTRNNESCLSALVLLVANKDPTMDVFLMIRRKKVTIFTDAKETTSLGEVKKIIEGICKVGPENQKLFREDQALTDDHKTLGDYGFTGATARAQAPATLGLAFRQEDGEWESLEVTSYSSPPELPDVMKPQDSSSSHAQEQSAS